MACAALNISVATRHIKIELNVEASSTAGPVEQRWLQIQIVDERNRVVL